MEEVISRDNQLLLGMMFVAFCACLALTIAWLESKLAFRVLPDKDIEELGRLSRGKGRSIEGRCPFARV